MRGETFLIFIVFSSLYHFNPLAPCGARLSASASAIHHLNISIHSPRAGRDFFSPWCCMIATAFQSTRPARGETPALLRSHKADKADLVFQSTRPVRGETFRKELCPARPSNFNPLAPCGARHFTRQMRDSPLRYFNPLAPCGARHPSGTVVLSIITFQSTRPVRGETPLPSVPAWT